MKKLKKIVLALITAVSLFGCKNQMDSKNGELDSITPYADSNTLESLSKKGFIDYKISRFFALIEMAEFANENGWQNAELSDYPMIIYGTESGEPRFYEFRVIDNGKEIGAIACVAKTTEGDPVRYVIPYATEINEQSARAIYNNEMKIIDCRYPSKLTTKNLNTGRIAEINLEENIDEYEVEVRVRDILETADENLLNDLGITSEELYNQYLKEQKEEEERIEKLWNLIYESADSITDVEDNEILSFIAENNSARDALVSTSTYYLQNWYNKSTWYNPGGYCGPNAMAFIALGFGPKSGYKNIPLSNNPTNLSLFYKTFADEIGNGPKVFSQLSDGLSKLTNYKLSTDLFHIWSTISSNMRDTGYPSVSLRSSKSLFDLAWHYRVIIGLKSEEYEKNNRFLFWSWTTYYNDNYYYMHDNGSDGNNFWENSGKLYQFWSAHVVSK